MNYKYEKLFFDRGWLKIHEIWVVGNFLFGKIRPLGKIER